MIIDKPDHVFELNEAEVETLRRAAVERDMPFAPSRTRYTTAELNEYGLCREAYNSPELKEMGIGSDKVVTSFDFEARAAREKLRVDAPFADKIRKWQIPVDICEWRVYIAEFPPGAFVEPHVHPANTKDNPGGSMRTVLKGSIMYAGKTFGPGDWFYIPNGVPYSFRTDMKVDTIVMYKYAFFNVAKGNRFSHPIELERYRIGTASVA
jgi:hypothetical protein